MTGFGGGVKNADFFGGQVLGGSIEAIKNVAGQLRKDVLILRVGGIIGENCQNINGLII